MTKCRQTPAIAEYPRAPRPVAVLRESAAECSGTPGLQRRGRAGPSCRDGAQLSSPWYSLVGFCHPQAVPEPWRCHGTKALAATAARRDPVEASTRQLKIFSSFQVSLPNAPDARRLPQKNTIGEDAMHPKLISHKLCTNRAEIREKVQQILRLQFATSNLSRELGALEWRVKSAVSHCRGLLSRCGHRQNFFHVNLGGVISRIAGGAVSSFFPIRASFLKTFQREIGE